MSKDIKKKKRPTGLKYNSKNSIKLSKLFDKIKEEELKNNELQNGDN